MIRMASKAISDKVQPPVVISWFRKGLRLHDNPALQRAVKFADDNKAVLRPIFILDAELPKSYIIGANRYRFLVDTLQDLDKSLRSIGSRLYVIRGKVDDVFENCFKTWNVKLVTFENDTEPYSRARDTQFYKLAKKYNVVHEGFWSHTLYEPSVLLKINKGHPPKTYQKFLDVVSKAGPPPKSLPAISKILTPLKDPLLESSDYIPPTLEELNVNVEELGPHLYPGGETVGLERMVTSLSNKKYVETFAKPDTSPNSIKPSTTVLSPYIKFGCLSARLFYEKLKEFKGTKTKPPVSLLGQLYWREFYYLVGTYIPNFTQMKGNTICKQINWDTNDEYYRAWREARTGYPYIDAIMTQLRVEGWIHHLARHSVACFLTRGDLWQHWEKGQETFEEYLLDADVYLNAGNWMWLSASAFFHQYYRVYSPVKFGQKTDPTGEYIRKYIPKLSKFPIEYIYEPWLAPQKTQQAAGCIIGKDYPKPIVDHQSIVKVNLQRMNQAYAKSPVSSQKVPPNALHSTSSKRVADTMDSDDDYADEIHDKTTETAPKANKIDKKETTVISKKASKQKSVQPTIQESFKRLKRQ